MPKITTSSSESAALAPGVVAQRPGAWSHVANVVLDPNRAFEGVAVRPTWAVALLALVTLRFVSLLAFYHPDTTPLKVVAGVFFQIGTVLPAALLMAFALWLAARGWRVPVTWARAWSIVLHVMFAYTLVTVAIASVAGALLPGSASVDLRHPPFTNLGAVAGADAPRLLRGLAAALDVRMAYALTLTWLALRCGGASRGRVTAAVGTVTAVYLVYVLVTLGR